MSVGTVMASGTPAWDPLGIARSLWHRRDVCLQLARREVELVYRGSILGFLWIVIQPLILLAVYALVFLRVFSGPEGESNELSSCSACSSASSSTRSSPRP